MTNAKFSRRTFFIDRGFQLKYTLLLVGAGTFVSLLFGEMMYVIHVNATRGLMVPESIQIELARSESSLLLLMGAVSLLMAGALGLFGVLITHRVAGPVYVMSHYISVLAKGRYPMMRALRKGDELHEFFDRFRDALETMRTREMDDAQQLEAAVAAFGPMASTPEGQALIQRLQTIAQRKREATERPTTVAAPEAPAPEAPAVTPA
jgi:hypothetical protein